MCVPAIWRERKTTPFFISMSILMDLLHPKNPRALFTGSAPNFIGSHVPMFPRKYFFFYETRKKRGNKKSFVNGKGVFQYSCILLRLGNTLELTHLGAPPLGRTHSNWNLPLQQNVEASQNVQLVSD